MPSRSRCAPRTPTATIQIAETLQGTADGSTAEVSWKIPQQPHLHLPSDDGAPLKDYRCPKYYFIARAGGAEAHSG